VRKAPEIPHVALGRVEFTGRNQQVADRGLQLSAGLLGADAVIGVDRQACPEREWGTRRVSGMAVRIAEEDGRDRLRFRYFAEEVASWSRRVLILLVLELLLLAGAVFILPGGAGLQPATGETRSEALRNVGLGLGLIGAWPLVLLLLLRVLRWPQLVRPTGLALLTLTTGRGLVVVLAHLVAIVSTGATLGESRLRFLADPVDWFLILAGLVVCLRGWRLTGVAHQILPPGAQHASRSRTAWSLGLLAATGLYALVLLGACGIQRYETSAHMLQPGINSRLEHQALLALNEGVAHSQKGDNAAAGRAFERSVRLWEELTAQQPAPRIYTENLAISLHDLGLVCEQQGRPDDVEKYFARAVALAGGLGGEGQGSTEYKDCMAYARQTLAELRERKNTKALEEKESAAVRKYEEAQVHAQQGDSQAERLYQEAIALFEEILPHATSPDYRKHAVARLAAACLYLGEQQDRSDVAPGRGRCDFEVSI
jgi:hypothetical protein